MGSKSKTYDISVTTNTSFTIFPIGPEPWLTGKATVYMCGIETSGENIPPSDFGKLILLYLNDEYIGWFRWTQHISMKTGVASRGIDATLDEIAVESIPTTWKLECKNADSQPYDVPCTIYFQLKLLKQ